MQYEWNNISYLPEFEMSLLWKSQNTTYISETEYRPLNSRHQFNLKPWICLDIRSFLMYGVSYVYVS